MTRAEGGFALIEAVLSIAALAVVVGAMFIVVDGMSQMALTFAQRAGETADRGSLRQRLQADAASSVAVNARVLDDQNPLDILGKSNSDNHEIRFYTTTGDGRGHFLAFEYDSNAKTLQEYARDPPGAWAPKGLPIAAVTQFEAHEFLASQSTIAKTLLGGYTPIDVRYDTVWPNTYGGNHLVRVLFTIGDTRPSMQSLRPGTFISGNFTVVMGYFTPNPASSSFVIPSPPPRSPPPFGTTAISHGTVTTGWTCPTGGASLGRVTVKYQDAAGQWHLDNYNAQSTSATLGNVYLDTAPVRIVLVDPTGRSDPLSFQVNGTTSLADSGPPPVQDLPFTANAAGTFAISLPDVGTMAAALDGTYDCYVRNEGGSKTGAANIDQTSAQFSLTVSR